LLSNEPDAAKVQCWGRSNRSGSSSALSSSLPLQLDELDEEHEELDELDLELDEIDLDLDELEDELDYN